MQVRFHEAARDELRAAARWYEAEREGLGEEFLSAVGQLIERAALGSSPGLKAAEFRKNTQKLFLKRFPYTIYFETRAASLIIWAVAHGKRKPGYWRKRS